MSRKLLRRLWWWCDDYLPAAARWQWFIKLAGITFVEDDEGDY